MEFSGDGDDDDNQRKKKHLISNAEKARLAKAQKRKERLEAEAERKRKRDHDCDYSKTDEKQKKRKFNQDYHSQGLNGRYHLPSTPRSTKNSRNRSIPQIAGKSKSGNTQNYQLLPHGRGNIASDQFGISRPPNPFPPSIKPDLPRTPRNSFIAPKPTKMYIPASTVPEAKSPSKYNSEAQKKLSMKNSSRKNIPNPSFISQQLRKDVSQINYIRQPLNTDNPSENDRRVARNTLNSSIPAYLRSISSEKIPDDKVPTVKELQKISGNYPSRPGTDKPSPKEMSGGDFQNYAYSLGSCTTNTQQQKVYKKFNENNRKVHGGSARAFREATSNQRSFIIKLFGIRTFQAIEHRKQKDGPPIPVKVQVSFLLEWLKLVKMAYRSWYPNLPVSFLLKVFFDYIAKANAKKFKGGTTLSLYPLLTDLFSSQSIEGHIDAVLSTATEATVLMDEGLKPYVSRVFGDFNKTTDISIDERTVRMNRAHVHDMALWAKLIIQPDVDRLKKLITMMRISMLRTLSTLIHSNDDEQREIGTQLKGLMKLNDLGCLEMEGKDPIDMNNYVIYHLSKCNDVKLEEEPNSVDDLLNSLGVSENMKPWVKKLCSRFDTDPKDACVTVNNYSQKSQVTFSYFFPEHYIFSWKRIEGYHHNVKPSEVENPELLHFVESDGTQAVETYIDNVWALHWINNFCSEFKKNITEYIENGHEDKRYVLEKLEAHGCDSTSYHLSKDERGGSDGKMKLRRLNYKPVKALVFAFPIWYDMMRDDIMKARSFKIDKNTIRPGYDEEKWAFFNSSPPRDLMNLTIRLYNDLHLPREKFLEKFRDPVFFQKFCKYNKRRLRLFTKKTRHYSSTVFYLVKKCLARGLCPLDLSTNNSEAYHKINKMFYDLVSTNGGLAPDTETTLASQIHDKFWKYFPREYKEMIEDCEDDQVEFRKNRTQGVNKRISNKYEKTFSQMVFVSIRNLLFEIGELAAPKIREIVEEVYLQIFELYGIQWGMEKNVQDVISSDVVGTLISQRLYEFLLLKNETKEKILLTKRITNCFNSRLKALNEAFQKPVEKKLKGAKRE